MNEINVSFADGSTQTFSEYQKFMSVRFFPDKESPDKLYPSHSGIYELWNHPHDGLIPSFLELLANSKFFFELGKPDVVFSASAIVKVEIL